MSPYRWEEPREDRGIHGDHEHRGRNGASTAAVGDVDLLAGLKNGAWLDAQVFPPLTYAVPYVVPEGSTLLVGPPKAGKSWLVLGIGLAVAAGGRALGRVVVEQRPVLYLALEDGDRRMQDRCRRLLGELERIPETFDYMTTVVGGTAAATIKEWLARHVGEQPLVILDTLGKVMPPALMGESPYQRDYRVGSKLKQLVDEHPGAALVVNHHDRKANAEDFVDSVSGTHGLAGAADTIVVLSRARHDPEGVLKVTGRDVAEGEYAIRMDPEMLWQLDGETFEEAAAKARRKAITDGIGVRATDIINFVDKHPEGVRAHEVEEELGEDARRYLTRLAKSGRLVRLERGRYALPNGVSQVSQCPKDQMQLGQRDTWDTPLEGFEFRERPSDDTRGMFR